MIGIKKCLLFIGCFLFVFFSFTIKASAAPSIERISGKDRYETSVAISQKNWQKSEYIILVSGENFPDALSAAPLSKKYDAPILLTEKGNLSNAVIQEIQRLQAKTVFIVGGIGVVSENVEYKLKSINITYSRIYGENRYETSVKVAEIIGTNNGVFVSSGENFPDAVSVAAIAALKQMPIVLTVSNRTPDNVNNFIANNSDAMYYIIGGQASVNSNVTQNIKNFKRLSGKDRYATNSAVVNEFLNSLTLNNVYLASGQDFPDALAGASAAAKNSAPIILVSNFFDAKNNLVKNNVANISKIKVLGGTGAVSDGLVNKVIKGQYITVCLDAGHGGYDPGAIGVTGIQEKDVNLSIVMKVGKILEQNSIGVVYTRTSDNVAWSANKVDSLQTRCDIADNGAAQYFIAVHNNSSSEYSNARGTETYYMEGDAISETLAQTIQQEIVNATGQNDRGIETANFYVLRNTNVPAVLIEVAFLSNAYDEQLLKSESFQNKVAEGIADGILKFAN